ncbi:MAG TPA: thioredoxin domain-containing protein [Oscillospiraceae bacterium]|nr:thioredoxin domain-containing protein [Oscillospiraceae bacterium]HPS34482.1 thioredoxin domain-containing protein [Oscillospiraceae bacterium]
MLGQQTTNRLIRETSPYLLEHAHNPVNWYPWGEEAFAKAKAEDKPIFLSVGYSACHWCHVMARESFEDETVAEILNDSFVSVKVDREERPDVDGVYMRACQAMTGNGGWPMSIFMGADKIPFFAGTYFPKDSFIQILESVSKAWKYDRESLSENGQEIAKAVDQKTVNRSVKSKTLIEKAVSEYENNFDTAYGGFGSAPKFPTPHNLLFLLATAPEMAEKTLDSMFRGGIFDHIGGGFSRYSTDRRWLIPHFEKMLYDNALLAMAYLTGFEKTRKELWRDIAERIFYWLEHEMAAPDGGFFSAQDADSEGVEGKFYVFTPDELKLLLGEAEGIKFCRRYGISPEGNFEGKSVPNLLESSLEPDKIDGLLQSVYKYRKKRPAPRTDVKILTAWNALTAAAYAMAARILKSEEYKKTAQKTIEYIEQNLSENGTLFSGATDGRRIGPGFLDDYAFLIFALIQMHQATLNDHYLDRAAELADRTWDLFWDGKNNGFFFSGAHNEALFARPKETWDGALPSGNSVMAYNLSRLALLTGDDKMPERAEKQDRFMSGEAASYPMGNAFYLWSLLPVKKVVCRLKTPVDLAGLRIPSDWAFRLSTDRIYPEVDGKTTYYVCENKTCHPATTEIPH